MKVIITVEESLPYSNEVVTVSAQLDDAALHQAKTDIALATIFALEKMVHDSLCGIDERIEYGDEEES